MNIRPLGEKVVIKKLDAQEKTKSGILLPNQAQEKPQIAEVMAVGPGGIVDGKEILMQVKVGDKVVFPKFAGTEIKLDGTEYTIIEESKLLGIIEE